MEGEYLCRADLLMAKGALSNPVTNALPTLTMQYPHLGNPQPYLRDTELGKQTKDQFDQRSKTDPDLSSKFE